MFDINNIPYEDNKTWSIIKKGHTSGVFQLESELGKQWASKIKPSNINELSAVLALLRPACLDSGMTKQYYLIKSGQEPPLRFDDTEIDSILEATEGVLIYQEQLMKFGSEIAWPDLPRLKKLVMVDKLRKGIGKKDSKLITGLRSDFLSGCVRNGRTEDVGHQLFELIESAGRYAFNDAHAKKYAIWTYRTAYLKANNPYEFYCVYMTYSKIKQKPREELYNLINEARMLGIRVLQPNVIMKNSEFELSQDANGKNIMYGLSHIKQVSFADVETIANNCVDTFQNLLNLMIRVDISRRLRVQSVIGLIRSGACDVYDLSRSSMLGLVDVVKSLSTKEKEHLSLKLDNCKDYGQVKDVLLYISENVSVKKRKDLVVSEIDMWNTEEEDDDEQMLVMETQLLGIEMSASVEYSTNKRKMNCKSCFSNYHNNDNKKGFLIGRVKEVREIVTKKGRNKGSKMAQLTISDSSGSIKVACFPDTYRGLMGFLEENQAYEFQLNGTGSGWCIKSANLYKK
jgi:DNA polymerase III subunit alpha